MPDRFQMIMKLEKMTLIPDDHCLLQWIIDAGFSNGVEHKIVTLEARVNIIDIWLRQLL